jgi:hypothetical protein
MNNWYFLSMENDLFLAGLAAIAMIGLALVAWRTAKKRTFSELTNSPLPAAAAPSPGQGIPLFIQYAEANGEVNSRRIDGLKVKEVQSEGTLRPRMLLFGWCHQRRARIEFAVARIVSLTDRQTGEVYDKTGAIAGYLRLVALDNTATPEDRQAEGYREIERAKRDRKLILAPVNASIEWQFSHGKGATQSARVWITAVAIGPDGRAYALFVESIGGGSVERPYFIKPRGSGHREVLTIEGEDESHEGEAIATWAEQWLSKTG